TRLGFQLAPELANEDVQIVIFTAVLWPPHSLQQVAPRDDLTRMLRQIFQHLVLGRSEVDLSPSYRDQAPLEINRQLAGLKAAVTRSPARLPCMSERNADACHQLSAAERFRHIIICALLEGGLLVCVATSHREDNNRNPRPRAQLAAYLDAVHIRQRQI